MEYFKVKDEVAFRAIRGKKVYIQSTIPNTREGVVVRSADLWDRDLSISGYKFNRSELEVWNEQP